MTTPVWLTAFAHGVPTSNNGPANAAIWDGSGLGGGTITISSAINRRVGGFSLEIDKTTSTSSCYVLRTMSAAQTVWVVRLYVYVQTMPTTSSRIFQLDATDTSDLYLFLNAAGNAFEIDFAGGGVAQTSSAITTNTWYRIDLLYDVSGTTWTCDWELDGVAQGQLTFANGAAGTGAVSLVFGMSSTGASVYKANITDFIASNTSADYPIGAGKGYYLLPSSMGTSINSTRFQEGDGTAIDASSYQFVDEWPPNQTGGNTDYIKQVTADAGGEASYIEFGLDDRPDSEGAINGVVGFLAYTSATTSANNAGCVVVKNGGTEITIYGDDAVPVDYSDGSITNYFYAAQVITAPGGGWTTAELNALLFRCGYSTDVSPNPYWGSLLIEYDVAPAVAGGVAIPIFGFEDEIDGTIFGGAIVR